MLAASLLGLPMLAAGAENPAEAVELSRIEIIGTTLLPGLGTPLRDVPANVQVFGAGELRRQNHLAEFLENNPNSVTANAAQGNPYQTDISFRGFTASPLLGVPQGLSVFQDGVRINEPFGDVVNWDLVPSSAIASMQLLPGSNPLFGFNTLGGALSLYTKSGSQYPGTAVELTGGSFGRRTLQAEHGGSSGAWDWFLTGEHSSDEGWATHNPSRVAQLFAKLGHQTEKSDLDISLTMANNRLEGSQTLPVSFLSTPRDAYTYPDINHNKVMMLAAKGSLFLAEDVLLGGNAYLRRLRNRNLSSNVNDEFGETDPDTGEVDTTEALNDRSATDQHGGGFGLQLTFSQPLDGRKNQFVVGGGADLGRTRFMQESQAAEFNDSRGAVATGDFETDTLADTRNRTVSVFAMDTFALTPTWTLTASGRFNDARVSIRDRSGEAPALNGDHAFRRFNPALGINFNPTPSFTAYASYNEGARAPTAMELTCADPEAPCKLPNSFLADPPLKQVVAHTLEIGARGQLDDARWSAAIFRTSLDDDIQFVSSGGAINAGYFRNVGTTWRQGVELSGSGTWQSLRFALRYSFIDAVYRTGFTEHSPDNASADADGDIHVAAGARVPGIPRQTLRARLDANFGEDWSAGATLLAASSSLARGNENAGDPRGTVAGYAVMHLDARYKPSDGIELFGGVNNLFDRRYANFGVLGRNVFANAERRFDPANGISEPFLGQGAPRTWWLGVRAEWP